MLSNIEPIGNLGSLSRFRGRDYVTKTVRFSSLEEMLSQGWSIAQKNEKSFRLKKDKEGNAALMDRVWSLLYRMGFLYLNGDGKAILTADLRDPKSQTIAIDVVGIDMEVGLAIWCRSSQEKCTRPTFRDELDEFIMARQRFAQSVNQEFPLPFDRQSKRVLALAAFTSGIVLSEDDKQHAKEGNIVLFGESELSYYETLVSHLGPAAKYQFLADTLPGKNIPGLNMRVPAIRARMGRFTCYTFSIPPEYLLKISYVSHRSKGRGSDIKTYQRMIQKSRLQKIRRYIDDKNIFPTNIVINFDIKPEFHQAQQETEHESGVMGWLDIRSAYKSAWIIDGQHRLFAYSGHPQASKARLSVLAFVMLPPNDQSQLFIDINHEQKSVKQSLLRELFGNLHEDAKEPELRIQAIITQAILSLDSDPDSPFYQRIQASDDKKMTSAA
jgi:DNA sulfur modification protein DndB